MVRPLQARAANISRQTAIPATQAEPRRSPAQLWLAACLPEHASRDDFTALAAWAECITPLVDREILDSLLFEVRGSLKLFGGLGPIKALLAAELEARALVFRLCAAPTALGALWLARHAHNDVLELEHMAASLGSLPVTVTRWPDAVLDLLQEMGVRKVGDCLRLPRGGFARRVGRPYLNDLDKALGRRADPRAGFKAPQSIAKVIEFSSQTEDMAVFAKAAQTLIEHVTARLRHEQRQLQGYEVIFHHLDREPTREVMRLVEPVHEKHRLLEPLLARLERIVLPAPAIAVGIEVQALVALRVETDQLFEYGLGSVRNPAPQAELIERLRGRLGVAGVYGVELVAEHRPEHVWNKLTDRLLQAVGRSGPVSPWAHDRPLWLLSEPVLLPSGSGRPGYRGPLRVESEPERIESGWWDGQEVRRDYYTATTALGQRLWVYRDCLTSQWFLHGIFG